MEVPPAAGAGQDGGRRRRRRRRGAAPAQHRADQRVPPPAHRRDLEATPARSSTSTPRPQLREVLFDQPRAARRQKKTKTGYSTDARRRSRSCWASTRSSSTCAPTARSRSSGRPTARACSSEVAGPTAASTPRFNQTVAGTGRPVVGPAPTSTTSRCAPTTGGGSARRSCRRRGASSLVADYNQIELRCIAHLAEDPGPHRRRSSRGSDIHTETAPRIFRVDPGDVTVEQRSKAKMVSYGLAYGMEAYGLGQRLEHPTSTRPPRSSTPTSWPSPAVRAVHGPHGGRGPRNGATPRPCSAGAGRSPSWPVELPDPPRRGSARP